MDVEENAQGVTTGRARRRRIVTGLLIGLLAAAALFGVTAVTGFPGPGAVRRYPVRDLQRLTDQINEDGSRWSCNDSDPPTARVDLVRSRVVIDWHGHASASRFGPDDQAMIHAEPHFSTLACATT